MRPRSALLAGFIGLALATTAGVAASPSAAGQLIGGGLQGLPGGLPGGVPGGLPGGLPSLPSARGLPDVGDRLAKPALETAAGALTAVRREAAQRLLREHRDLVEADDRGQPVVRGEVLALGLDAPAIERLRQAGYEVRRAGGLAGLAELGLSAQVLGAPRGKSAVAAVRELRALVPGGQFDFNHLYLESGGAARALSAGRSEGGAAAEGSALRLGLVDGSVAESRPALAGARLTQQAFAPGGAKATAHATAVASLMVGTLGSAPGAALAVADVYGPTAAGGSADAIARGLAWLAHERAPVIDISLVGPPNALLQAAVAALVARGHLLVAAVGNDGPAAAPLYPASYPGVVAVTGVDGRRRVLPEAGRGTHVDFAAPGAEMKAAGMKGGLVAVRGTSYAAPIVAGRLAALLPAPDPAAAKAAVQALGDAAADLGAPGPDPVYGRGLVERR